MSTIRPSGHEARMPTPTLHSPTVPTHRRWPARRRRALATLVAAGLGTLAGSLCAPAGGAAAQLQPRSAAAFRDSIGVQTHFPFTGYAYDAAPTSQLAGMLRMIGVRHLRDDVCLNTEQACQRVRARMAEMRGALGADAPPVDLLAGYTRELAAQPDRAARDADIERALTAAASPPLAPMLAGLESVNEPDLKDTTDWAAAALADDDTFHRLLAQPRFAALRTLPQLSPAIGHAANTPSLLASGWTPQRADVGNFHPYPAAWGGPEHALGTACGATDALSCARALGQAAAPIATESGYSTSGTILSTNWVSERAQGIYLPRLLLENFRRGVARTYLYELIDLKPLRGSAVDGYGLWRARAVGSQFLPGEPKPAALALARMNATIGDLGAPGAETADAIDVTLRAAGRDLDDDAVRRVLLRRADGSLVLALWQPKAVWTNAVLRQADTTPAELPVDVQLGGATWDAVATRPSLADAPTGQWRDARTLRLPIGADVTLLELRRTGDAPAPVDDAPMAAAETPATGAAVRPSATPVTDTGAGSATPAPSRAAAPPATKPARRADRGRTTKPSRRAKTRKGKASRRAKAARRAQASRR